MSLLVLFPSSGPVTTAGYRSMFAVWMGGAGITGIGPTTGTSIFRSGILQSAIIQGSTK